MRTYLESPDTVCIFPTEVAARFWRDWSARHGTAPAVRSDRFLSWDTFIQSILTGIEGRKQADEYFRRAAAWILLEEARQGPEPVLKFLVPPAYRSEAAQFHRMITGLLPKLEGLISQRDSASLPDELYADLLRLRDRYRSILSSRGYYEPFYEQQHIDLSRLESSRSYVIFFPHIIMGYQQLKERLIRDEGFPTVDESELNESFPGGGGEPTVAFYQNSAAELAAVMDWTEQLLHSGVGPSQICLTVGDYAQWQSELKHEAALRGIPLSFHQGIPASVHPGGRLFSDLADAYRQGWPLKGVKRLLLNRSYPWKQAEQMQRIAELGIEKRCIGGPSPEKEDPWHRMLRRQGEEELLQLWKRFTAHVRQMVEERSPHRMRETLLGFLDLWMDRGNRRVDEYSLMFDHCLEQGLTLFETCEAAGLEEVPSLYQFWLQLLEHTKYVPPTDAGGVRVYPYGVSAGIRPEHHAVVNVSQETVSLQQPAIPYFSENALSRFNLTGEDPSREVLQLYSQGGEELLISCSKETFSGYALPPADFITEGRVTEGVQSQPTLYEREQQWWALEGEYSLEECYPLQQEGLSYAWDTLFQKKGFDLFEARFSREDRQYQEILQNTLCRKKPGYIRVSPTSLDRFSSCRFSWVFRFLLGIDEYPSDPPFVDARDEGTLMHRCLQRFFDEVIGRGNSFQEGMLSRYHRKMAEVLSLTLDEYQRKYAWMTPLIRSQLETQLLRLFDQFLEQEEASFNKWSCLGTEEKLSFTDEQRRFFAKGVIDRIAQSPSGDGYAIIDYKRSESSVGKKHYADQDRPPPSYQLPFYAWLIGRTGYCTGVPEAACFYVLKEAKYVPAYDRWRNSSKRSGWITEVEKFQRLVEDTETAAAEMAASVWEGDFTGSVNPENCRNCNDRKLCRRRYHVRS